MRLSGADDSLAANDEAERPVEVAAALPVLLVDGEPGVEPLSGETDFLRAALAPAEDEAPAVKARVVKTAEFSAEALKGRRVVVLANVDRLDPAQVAALSRLPRRRRRRARRPGGPRGRGFLQREHSISTATARCRRSWASGRGTPRAGRPWRTRRRGRSPARRSGRSAGRRAAPGRGRPVPYRVLHAGRGRNPAAAIARLDTGDPWAVERPFRKGRVIVLAGPLDAEGGTLPVNPDFVPLVHELIFHLADPVGRRPADPPRRADPPGPGRDAGAGSDLRGRHEARRHDREGADRAARGTRPASR